MVATTVARSRSSAAKPRAAPAAPPSTPTGRFALSSPPMPAKNWFNICTTVAIGIPSLTRSYLESVLCAIWRKKSDRDHSIDSNRSPGALSIVFHNKVEQLQGGGAGVADARRLRRTEVDPRALGNGITFLLQGNHSLAFHQVNELVSVAHDLRLEAFSLNQPAQPANNFFGPAERPVDDFSHRTLSGKLDPGALVSVNVGCGLDLSFLSIPDLVLETSLLLSLSFAPKSCRPPAPTEGRP